MIQRHRDARVLLTMLTRRWHKSVLRIDDYLPLSDGGAFIPARTRDNTFVLLAEIIIVLCAYALRIGPASTKV